MTKISLQEFLVNEKQFWISFFTGGGGGGVRGEVQLQVLAKSRGLWATMAHLSKQL